MGEGNSWHRSLNSSCVAAQYREELVWKRQIVSAAYLNIPLTSLIWDRETPNIPSRSRNKVGSSPYQQVFIWRKTPLTFLLCWIWKEKNRRKKKLLFSGFGGFLVFGLFFFLTYTPSFSIPFYPTPSWLPHAAARSRCHHLFLYFPHLGGWNRSWLSFLADSVISARPQLGRAPRPTGDPCSCRTAGRRLCM